MSRLLSVIGLAVLAGFAVAACHSSGPPGSDPGDMGPPMMYQAPSPASHSPATPTVCNPQSSGAVACLR